MTPSDVLPDRIACRLDTGLCDCWIWTGPLIRTSPCVSWNGKSDLGTRVVYKIVYGPIPKGAQIRHRCGQSLCMRPDHLYLDDRSTSEGLLRAFVEMVTARIEVLPNECWHWTGAVNRWGYAVVETTVGNKSNRLARIMYELVIGPIPDGLVLDHLCHTRDETCPGGASCPHHRCVNPSHLEPVTVAENNLRGRSQWAVNARKTHCPQGHPYDEQNTRFKKYRGGIVRVCKTCAREQRRNARRRKREVVRRSG